MDPLPVSFPRRTVGASSTHTEPPLWRTSLPKVLESQDTDGIFVLFSALNCNLLSAMPMGCLEQESPVLLNLLNPSVVLGGILIGSFKTSFPNCLLIGAAGADFWSPVELIFTDFPWFWRGLSILAS